MDMYMWIFLKNQKSNCIFRLKGHIHLWSKVNYRLIWASWSIEQDDHIHWRMRKFCADATSPKKTNFFFPKLFARTIGIKSGSGQHRLVPHLISYFFCGSKYGNSLKTSTAIISTNNIANGLVRVRKIRFQPTQNTFSSDLRNITDPATPKSNGPFFRKRYSCPVKATEARVSTCETATTMPPDYLELAGVALSSPSSRSATLPSPISRLDLAKATPPYLALKRRGPWQAPARLRWPRSRTASSLRASPLPSPA
jgi:hypothetical protein